MDTTTGEGGATCPSGPAGVLEAEGASRCRSRALNQLRSEQMIRAGRRSCPQMRVNFCCHQPTKTLLRQPPESTEYIAKCIADCLMPTASAARCDNAKAESLTKTLELEAVNIVAF
jgi:hypothetical protein